MVVGNPLLIGSHCPLLDDLILSECPRNTNIPCCDVRVLQRVLVIAKISVACHCQKLQEPHAMNFWISVKNVQLGLGELTIPIVCNHTPDNASKHHPEDLPKSVPSFVSQGVNDVSEGRFIVIPD